MYKTHVVTYTVTITMPKNTPVDILRKTANNIEASFAGRVIALVEEVSGVDPDEIDINVE